MYRTSSMTYMFFCLPVVASIGQDHQIKLTMVPEHGPPLEQSETVPAAHLTEPQA